MVSHLSFHPIRDFLSRPLRLTCIRKTHVRQAKIPSTRTVDSALAKWDAVVQRYGWDRVIHSDDPCRGGKLTAFVVHMVEDTSLHWESIRSYVWGLRSWMKLQRQVDPIFGVYGWQDFMSAVQVHTWQVNEPRKQVPVALLRRALSRGATSGLM